MPLAPGQVLNNRYRIVKLLGQGGMGAVYKAWDLNMERPRALKENLDVSPEAQRQFKREAQILGDLSHPTLPKVIDHFTIPGQGQYLVMEFVEGEDLGEMLARLGGPLPAAQALGWIGQVCAALEYLHSQNPPVIHRDIKPANIKVTPQGNAMLVDFGIAKVFDPNLSTTVGAKAVTPGYSPIEQYGSGLHTGPATDVYALGATLYTLLSGQAPPQAPDRNLGVGLGSLMALNPSVTPALEAAVVKAMAMLPQERFHSAADFAAALRPAPPQPATVTVPQAPGASFTGSTAPYLAPQTLAAPATRRKLNWVWIVGMVALLAIAGWVATSLSNSRRQQSTGQTATPVAALLDQLTPSPFPSSPTPLSLPSFTPTSLPATRASLLSTHTPLPLSPTSTRTPITFTSSKLPTDAQLGDAWTRPADGMRMFFIPAGDFLMGSHVSDPDGESDEKPQHTVYLDAYWIDQTEVTNAQYAKCVAARQCRSPSPTNSYSRSSYYGDAQYDSYPVIYVSWKDASAYCAWAGGRLPTEAEWEKAARGTDGQTFPWGEEGNACRLANYHGCVGDTSATGRYPAGASPYGLLDVAGNVWEWVQDWYSETYYASSPDRNPAGPSSGQERVLRGGSWRWDWGRIRTADRDSRVPSLRYFWTGFRCAAPPGA